MLWSDFHCQLLHSAMVANKYSLYMSSWFIQSYETYPYVKLTLSELNTLKIGIIIKTT